MQGKNAEEARTWIEAWRKGPKPPAASTSAPSSADSSSASSSQSKSPSSEAGKVRLRLIIGSGLQDIKECNRSRDLNFVSTQSEGRLCMGKSCGSLHVTL